MDEKEFTLTIICKENGDVILRDDRNGNEVQGKGILLHLGDHWESTVHNFAWGSGSSIITAFMGSVLGARDDQSEDANYYRYIYSHIIMNIEQLTGKIRERGVITAEEAVKKYGIKQEGTDDDTTH